MKHAFCLRFAYRLTMEYSVAREAAIITLIPLCKIAFGSTGSKNKEKQAKFKIFF